MGNKESLYYILKVPFVRTLNRWRRELSRVAQGKVTIVSAPAFIVD